MVHVMYDSSIWRQSEDVIYEIKDRRRRLTYLLHLDAWVSVNRRRIS